MKIWTAVVVNDGYIYHFVSDSEEGVLKELAGYCKENWEHSTWLGQEGVKIPKTAQEVVDAYFCDGSMSLNEDEYYDIRSHKKK